MRRSPPCCWRLRCPARASRTRVLPRGWGRPGARSSTSPSRGGSRHWGCISRIWCTRSCVGGSSARSSACRDRCSARPDSWRGSGCSRCCRCARCSRPPVRTPCSTRCARSTRCPSPSRSARSRRRYARRPSGCGSRSPSPRLRSSRAWRRRATGARRLRWTRRASGWCRSRTLTSGLGSRSDASRGTSSIFSRRILIWWS